MVMHVSCKPVVDVLPTLQRSGQPTEAKPAEEFINEAWYVTDQTHFCILSSARHVSNLQVIQPSSIFCVKKKRSNFPS